MSLLIASITYGSKWFIIVTCAYIYTIIYNYIYKHIKSTRPYGPISHQINKYIN